MQSVPSSAFSEVFPPTQKPQSLMKASPSQTPAQSSVAFPLGTPKQSAHDELSPPHILHASRSKQGRLVTPPQQVSVQSIMAQVILVSPPQQVSLQSTAAHSSVVFPPQQTPAQSTAAHSSVVFPPQQTPAQSISAVPFSTPAQSMVALTPMGPVIKAIAIISATTARRDAIGAVITPVIEDDIISGFFLWPFCRVRRKKKRDIAERIKSEYMVYFPPRSAIFILTLSHASSKNPGKERFDAKSLFTTVCTTIHTRIWISPVLFFTCFLSQHSFFGDGKKISPPPSFYWGTK
jgi:hypothetical protein